MAFRCLRFIKNMRCTIVNSSFVSISQNSHRSLSTVISKNKHLSKQEFITEHNITYMDDPDTFGTLSIKTVHENVIEDEGDMKEEKYLHELPLQSQKLTTKQYADIMKQYIKHKRIKEALNVLEVRMLQEDRVKPENYIYNILIGAYANVGYTKKAFKLYNDMKKRNLKPTGDTYTCLFTACFNSPWVTDGLKHAKHLRALMVEKGIEPNLTNYNVMIKTFGRCGDLSTAFELVDEMISKKIKIRVHTFNHLLHACITDKHNGLRHALIVWRKMLKMREKPNIYSFNLMLKCIKDCNLGSKHEINELIGILEENMVLKIWQPNIPLQIESATTIASVPEQNFILSLDSNIDTNNNLYNSDKYNITDGENCTKYQSDKKDIIEDEKSEIGDEDKLTMELVDHKNKLLQIQTKENIPNLLSQTLQMDKVFALQDVHTLQDKFAVVGGQEEFLKEMEIYSVQPNVKIFTQMLSLIDDSTEAEINLIEAMKLAKVKPDIDFYNLLIRKRCLRLDYEKAYEVKDMIVKERKKRHPLNKKQKLKENIMTYGVLALACRTKDTAVKLLDEMAEKQIRINIQILGTLLKHATFNTQFDYIMFVMNLVKEEKVMVNDIFIQHLENFNDKCATIMKQSNEKGTVNKGFAIAYKNFLHSYKKWSTEVNVEEALKREHPWQQFQETYPTTVQRENFKIKEPKKFYKRNRKFVIYAPQLK